jgi:hypothetical protein
MGPSLLAQADSQRRAAGQSFKEGKSSFLKKRSKKSMSSLAARKEVTAHGAPFRFAS